MTRILFCNSWLDHQRIKDTIRGRKLAVAQAHCGSVEVAARSSIE